MGGNLDMAHIISIANQKGGVAKTTTTINLGAALSMSNYRVLLVDMDPQAHCSIGLGIRVAKDEPAIHNILLNPKEDITDKIYETPLERLFVIPSHINLAVADQELSSQVGSEWVLSIALRKIREDYDYIIIDTPPSLGNLSINSIVASESIIIPMQAEIYALEGMEALQELITRIIERLGHSVQVLGVLITQYQGRTRIHEAVKSQLDRYWGDTMFNTVIRKNVDISAAVAKSTPVVIAYPDSMGAADYLNLAKEVIAIERGERRAEESGGAETEDAEGESQSDS